MRLSEKATDKAHGNNGIHGTLLRSHQAVSFFDCYLGIGYHFQTTSPRLRLRRYKKVTLSDRVRYISLVIVNKQ